MRLFSAILIAIGSVGMVFQLFYAFIFDWEMAAHLGKATGFAIVFLLPGVILYIKTGKKKSANDKGRKQEGDWDATKTKETTSKAKGKKKGGET